jgi:hypothetical protein
LKDLVIFRSGTKSLHSAWKSANSEAAFDVFICPYHELPDGAKGPGTLVGYIIKGPKWTGLRELLKTWHGWRDYRYIMLADDDLLMTEETVSKFFKNCAAQNANLAQPALIHESPSSHLMVFRNTRFLLRSTSFVEIMAPCFRVEVLKDLLWTLDLTETGWGWGLDHLWPKLLDFERTFIFDTTPMFHTLPVGRGRNEEMHKKIKAEHDAIIKKYDCRPQYKTLRGVTLEGKELAFGNPRLLHNLIMGYEQIFNAQPHFLISLIKDHVLVPPPIPAKWGTSAGPQAARQIKTAATW